MTAVRHTPVLLDEVISLLSPRPGEVYIDCTAGQGGHARAVAERLGPEGLVVLNDADPGNLREAAGALHRDLATRCPQVIVIHGNFAGLPARLARQSSGRPADMLLADLGFASSQMDDAARGLSFAREGPLDMRFDPFSPVTAAELVNGLEETELARILHEFGEERHARRIARKIVEARGARPISTTGDLARIVRSACGVGRRKPGTIDAATRTFQALRIAVNDELGSLQTLLDAVGAAARQRPVFGSAWLGHGARVAVISFHSLEDRPVKQAFAQLASEGRAERLTRKPVQAGDAELAANPRSRSAKLRAVRLLP